MSTTPNSTTTTPLPTPSSSRTPAPITNSPYSHSPPSEYEPRFYDSDTGLDDYSSPHPIVVMAKYGGFIWNEECFVNSRRRNQSAGDDNWGKESVVEIRLSEDECDIFPA